MFEPLQSGIGRHALADVILLGAIAGAVGVWGVSYGLSYGAESLSHGLLPGVVAAALIRAPIVSGARGGACATALLIATAPRDAHIGFEVSTAVGATAMLGL